MKECLVTKLKADTGNNSLLRVGEMLIDIIEHSSPTNQTNKLYLMNASEDIVLEVEDGSANLTTDENMATGWVSKMTLPKSSITAHAVFVRNGNYRIKVRPKYTMLKIGDYTANVRQIAICVDTKYLRFNEKLTHLVVGKISGNITDLSKTKLIAVQAISESPQLTGDIASLAPLTSLTRISLHDSQLTGDIASLAPLTSLTALSLYGNSKVTGDIKTIKAPLTTIAVYNTNVGGELIEFVKTQRAQGRTTGSCSSSWWGTKITFNGVVPSGNNLALTWTEASITLGSTTVNQ